MEKTYVVDPDISIASTIDSQFYHDAAAYATARERIFARAWQWIGDLHDVAAPGTLSPRELLPGLLNEPLLLARDAEGTLRCLSNVCTHRGNLLVRQACAAEQIRCGYHSRRFDLSGRMTFMPEFRAAKNFPSPRDDLPRLPFGEWAGHGFAAIDPVAPLDIFLAEMATRTGWLPTANAAPEPSRSRDYVIDAHWALYVENYLEGFHIPFVHAGLNQVLDTGANTYTSELFRYSNLQLASARENEVAFDPPAGSPDHGKRVAAYYWWIFPNLMLNFYPWGLSVNLVQPEAVDRTRVAFRSYVWDASKLEHGAGAALHEVEMEDEAIVLAVQRGTQSRFYRKGRYSPTREQGTHHFHRLLCEFLNRV
ncbi:MAG: aromatic ring-hydroxylating dioxygenase subunit alpha [Usitatibacteraceae bacterium]